MKIAGFSLKEQYGIRVGLTSPDSYLPNVNTHLQELGTFGAVNYGITFGTKEFSFDCIITGKDYHTKFLEFTKLYFNHLGKVKDVKLELPWLPNKYYMVSLAGNFELVPLSDTSASFTLNLIASDPFSYSIYSTERYVEKIEGGLVEIPLNYYGTYPVGINLSMFGNLSYFDIEVHDAGGVVRVFHYISPSHDTFMKMDFVNFEIDDNGTNGLPYSTGIFPEVNSATEKIVIRGDISTSVNVQLRERYI